MTNQTVLVLGAAGYMGRLITRLAADDGWDCIEVDAQLQPDVDRALADLLPRAHLAVDFSSPQGTRVLLEHLQKHPLPCVVGTTGLDAAHHEALAALARHAPVACATNFSLGMNLLWVLAEKAAAFLPPDLFDAEILEAHHRRKKDAPSGSARTLAQHVQAGRTAAGFPAGETAFHDSASGPRRANDIGMAVVRGGDVVGEHTVLFLGSGERLELTHRVTDRAIFARGAWMAALHLQGKPPGLYPVRELLGLNALLS